MFSSFGLCRSPLLRKASARARKNCGSWCGWCWRNKISISARTGQETNRYNCIATRNLIYVAVSLIEQRKYRCQPIIVGHLAWYRKVCKVDAKNNEGLWRRGLLVWNLVLCATVDLLSTTVDLLSTTADLLFTRSHRNRYGLAESDMPVVMETDARKETFLLPGWRAAFHFVDHRLRLVSCLFVFFSRTCRRMARRLRRRTAADPKLRRSSSWRRRSRSTSKDLSSRSRITTWNAKTFSKWPREMDRSTCFRCAWCYFFSLRRFGHLSHSSIETHPNRIH